jgi:hypothetical protein
MILRYGALFRRFIVGGCIFSLYFLFSWISNGSIVGLPILPQIAVYIMIICMLYGLGQLFNKWTGYNVDPFLLIGIILYSIIFLLIKNLPIIPMVGELCGISFDSATQLINVFLFGNAISNIALSYCIGRWGLKIVGITGMMSSFVFLGIFHFLAHPFLMFFVLGCSMSNIMNVIWCYFDLVSQGKNYMTMISVGFLIPYCVSSFMMNDINYGLSLNILTMHDVIYGVFALFLMTSCAIFIFSLIRQTEKHNHIFHISFLNKNMYWLTILNTLVICITRVGIKDKIPEIAQMTGGSISVLRVLDFRGGCMCFFVLAALLFVFKSSTVLLMYSVGNILIILMLIIVFLGNFYFTSLTNMFVHSHNILFIIRGFLNTVVIQNVILMSGICSKSYMIMQFINSRIEKNVVSFFVLNGLLNFLVVIISVTNILSYIPIHGMLFVCCMCSFISLSCTLFYRKQTSNHHIVP